MKTGLLIFILTMGAAKSEPGDIQQEEPLTSPDICIGCEPEEEAPQQPQTATIEIRIDPVTGKVKYIIKGIQIELK